MKNMVVMLTIALALTTAVRAGAQVSCVNPDDLCTGDPCVIGTVTIVPPCEVDFGNRALEIDGVLSVPDGGTLSFSASSIQLLGHIDGRNVGVGAAVTLVTTGGETTGELDIEGKIDVAGDAGGGSVTLTSTNDLTVAAKIRARGMAGPGGSVRLSAFGFTSVQQPIDVRGTTGGSIATQTGFMQVVGSWDARGVAGSGGSVAVSGSLTHFFKTIDVSGQSGDGGTVIVSGTLNVGTAGKVVASGSANGGAINFSGPILVWGKLFARGKSGNGGTLVVSAPDPLPNGTVSILRAKGDFRGAEGGGSIQIGADEVVVQRSKFMVGGATGPGEIRMHQSGTAAGEVSGKLDAHPSGIIEVLAPNADLTVSGAFSAGPAGCVGVSAGGMLDTTGLVSDVALTPNCP